MKVKIDTKEKFHVLMLQEAALYANMTEELNYVLLSLLETDKKSVALNMEEINEIDELAAKYLVSIQQKFYAANASFVICELKPAVEAHLEKLELLDVLNVTPTVSEAGDIVQLEEIERELDSPTSEV